MVCGIQGGVGVPLCLLQLILRRPVCIGEDTATVLRVCVRINGTLDTITYVANDNGIPLIHASSTHVLSSR